MDIAKMIASHMFNDSTKQKVIDGLNKNINIPIINEETEEKVLTAIYEVIEDVMYWRKANHIHNWFVSNCQGGVDECQETRVSLDQLKELSALCKKVVDDKDPNLMQTVQGFFFGSQDYDQYYYDECSTTHEVIEKLVKEMEDEPKDVYSATFYYQSSW